MLRVEIKYQIVSLITVIDDECHLYIAKNLHIHSTACIYSRIYFQD